MRPTSSSQPIGSVGRPPGRSPALLPPPWHSPVQRHSSPKAKARAQVCHSLATGILRLTLCVYLARCPSFWHPWQLLSLLSLHTRSLRTLKPHIPLGEYPPQTCHAKALQALPSYCPGWRACGEAWASSQFKYTWLFLPKRRSRHSQHGPWAQRPP